MRSLQKCAFSGSVSAALVPQVLDIPCNAKDMFGGFPIKTYMQSWHKEMGVTTQEELGPFCRNAICLWH